MDQSNPVNDLKFPDVHIEHCPMLIGIMRRAPREETESSPFKYQFQILQRCDLLLQTRQRSIVKNVLETLKAFREEWHQNQQFRVPFDVSRSNFLCIDVLLEIVKYISWSDAIIAFSIGVLSLLRDTHTKVHLNDPSHRFLQMIQQHFDPSRIASLRVTDDFRAPEDDFSLFRTFDQLASLTVVSKRTTYERTRLLCYLPNVRFVFLLFDGDMNWFDFTSLLRDLRDHSSTRLHIRCSGVRCHDSRDDFPMEPYILNTSITSFAFHSGHHPMRSHTNCRQNDSLCFFDSAVKLIQSMVNISTSESYYHQKSNREIPSGATLASVDKPMRPFRSSDYNRSWMMEITRRQVANIEREPAPFSTRDQFFQIKTL